MPAFRLITELVALDDVDFSSFVDGQVLSWDAGTQKIKTVPSSGGGPGGANGDFQYNHLGGFAGVTGITSDGTSLIAGAGNLQAPDITDPNGVGVNLLALGALGNGSIETILADSVSQDRGAGWSVNFGGAASGDTLDFSILGGTSTTVDFLGNWTYRGNVKLNNKLLIFRDNSGNLNEFSITGVNGTHLATIHSPTGGFNVTMPSIGTLAAIDIINTFTQHNEFTVPQTFDDTIFASDIQFRDGSNFRIRNDPSETVQMNPQAGFGWGFQNTAVGGGSPSEADITSIGEGNDLRIAPDTFGGINYSALRLKAQFAHHGVLFPPFTRDVFTITLGNLDQGFNVIPVAHFNPCTVAELPVFDAISHPNGSVIFVSDAKNGSDDGAINGSVVAPSGHGSFAVMQSGQWVITTGIGSGGGGGSPAGSDGDIQFALSGAFAADNSNLFWDRTNHRLGVGTNTPRESIETSGKILLHNAQWLYSRNASDGGQIPLIGLDSSNHINIGGLTAGDNAEVIINNLAFDLTGSATISHISNNSSLNWGDTGAFVFKGTNGGVLLNMQNDGNNGVGGVRDFNLRTDVRLLFDGTSFANLDHFIPNGDGTMVYVIDGKNVANDSVAPNSVVVGGGGGCWAFKEQGAWRVK